MLIRKLQLGIVKEREGEIYIKDSFDGRDLDLETHVKDNSCVIDY